MQHSYERGARRLVEWSPLHSNYFAYSYGELGNGINLYHAGRPAVDADPGFQVGARGSITDKPHQENAGVMGAFMSGAQQV